LVLLGFQIGNFGKFLGGLRLGLIWLTKINPNQGWDFKFSLKFQNWPKGDFWGRGNSSRGRTFPLRGRKKFLLEELVLRVYFGKKEGFNWGKEPTT